MPDLLGACLCVERRPIDVGWLFNKTHSMLMVQTLLSELQHLPNKLLCCVFVNFGYRDFAVSLLEGRPASPPLGICELACRPLASL